MMTSRSLLTRLIDTATSEVDLFLDDRAEAYALIRKEGLLLRLRGRSFRLWLIDRAHDLAGQVPGTTTMSAIRDLLEVRARRGPRRVLWNRVARWIIEGQASAGGAGGRNRAVV